MATTLNDKKTIGIVGGGNVGCQLLDLFDSSQQTQVAFVMDINSAAPALEAARKKGVKTFTDLQMALTAPVDFLLEVTGNEKVVETIKSQIADTQICLITHEMAHLMINSLNENNQQARERVVGKITGIGGQIDQSLGMIKNLVNSIEDITAQMNILAINARIEAARVGNLGASFAVVASAMGESAEKVKEITSQISKVNETMEKASQEINFSLRAFQ